MRTVPSMVLGAFSFLLVVGYVPGILNEAAAGRMWLLTLGIVTAVCVVAPNPKFTLGHVFGAALLAWAAVSLCWTSSLPDGIEELWLLMLYGGAFCIGAQLPTLRPIYIGLGYGIAVNSAIAVCQWYFGLDTFDYIRPGPSGLFMNANYLAEAAALVFVALFADGLGLLAAACLPAIWLPNYKGAFAALAGAFIVWLWSRARLLAAAATVLAIAACATQLHTASTVERFSIWQDTLAGLTPLGRGLGSFFTSYPLHNSHYDLLFQRPAHAHNDFLEMVYELGPGAVLFVALLVVCLSSPLLRARAVLAAFIMEACFEFPLHNPVPGFIAAIAAGHLCGARLGLYGEFDRWRERIHAGAQAPGRACRRLAASVAGA